MPLAEVNSVGGAKMHSFISGVEGHVFLCQEVRRASLNQTPSCGKALVKTATFLSKILTS